MNYIFKRAELKAGLICHYINTPTSIYDLNIDTGLELRREVGVDQDGDSEHRLLAVHGCHGDTRLLNLLYSKNCFEMGGAMGGV